MKETPPPLTTSIEKSGGIQVQKELVSFPSAVHQEGNRPPKLPLARDRSTCHVFGQMGMRWSPCTQARQQDRGCCRVISHMPPENTVLNGFSEDLQWQGGSHCFLSVQRYERPQGLETRNEVTTGSTCTGLGNPCDPSNLGTISAPSKCLRWNPREKWGTPALSWLTKCAESGRKKA